MFSLLLDVEEIFLFGSKAKSLGLFTYMIKTPFCDKKLGVIH